MRSLRSVLCLGILALHTCAAFLVRTIDSLLSLFAPQPLVLAGDSPVLARRIDGQALDRSLLTGLRHESGVRRRSSDRNI